MSIESRSQHYGSIFGNWHIGKKLGSGSNGQSAVFELYRDHEGWREYSALKVISLIEERGIQDTMPLFQRNDYSTASKALRSQAEQEVRLMDQVRGKTNIVDYLDHKFFEWSDETGFGTDLLIRMELLTDLRSQMKKGRLAEQEIIKIGRDLCQALVICHGKEILHRDIKPENIFVSEDGDYKLGDFGVSRILSNSSAALASTGIGSPAYSAPEQFIGNYDHRVDIYSLGLVLYELCNGNRLPFARSQYITKDEIQIRLAGTPLPAPGAEPAGDPYRTMPADCAAPLDPRLSRIILKACAFDPRGRYQSAREMLEDLMGLAGGDLPMTDIPPMAYIPPIPTPKPTPAPKPMPDAYLANKPQPHSPAVEANTKTEKDTKLSKYAYILGILVFAVIFLLLLRPFLLKPDSAEPNAPGSYADSDAADSNKQYTYNIVYISSNGTNLGAATADGLYGTTSTITPPAFEGYITPSAQTVIWDSVNDKTITFVYDPTPAINATKQEYIKTGTTYKLGYSADVEYQNRTATSIQLRIVWTTTLSGSQVYNAYGQRFVATVEGVSTDAVEVVSYGTWKSESSSPRSASICTDWITVPLTTTNATAVNMSIYYYQVNRYGEDMTKSSGASGSNTVWMINIPAY